MKVLLINPPTLKNEVWVREGRCQQFDIWGAPFPPLSLAYIAGQINNLADTLIIDAGPAGLTWTEVLKRIKKIAPDLLLISCATPTIKNDLDFFAAGVKKILPSLKSAALGIHVSALPAETLKNFPAIDFVIIGEPEITAKELVLTIKNKGNFNNIPGLGFKKNNEIIINRQREFLDDLDKLSPPAWPGVDFSNYRMPIINKPFNLIAFARGCPFNCKFCASSTYYGKKIRKREPQKIIEEIKENISRKINDFLFWTEFATADKNYLFQVLAAIKAAGLDKKIRWVTNSRVDFVDQELLEKLKQTGCWQIIFGLEFGSDKILKLAQKGGNATVAQGRKAVAEAVAAGLVVDGHFMLGYPGETETTLEETIKLACSLPLTFAHFYSATPFPGSYLYEEAVRQNWLVNPDWGQTVQNLANLKTDYLKPETVNEYLSLAYKKFYLRPTTIWRIAKIAKNVPEFYQTIKLGLAFFASILKKKL